MIWIFDLLLLVAVSVLLGIRELYLGVIVFSLGLFFEFQFRRTRALIGDQESALPLARKVKGVLFALLLSGFCTPLIFEEGIMGPRVSDGHIDWALPLIVLLGMFCASLMVSLSVERRKR